MTLKSAVLLATSFLSVPASATTINPYVFDAPAVLQRPEVSQTWNRLHLNVTPAQAAGLTTIRADDASLVFFKEVASFLEAGAAAKNQPNNSSLPDSAACALHSAADAGRFARSCGELGTSVARLLVGAKESCLSIAEPERRIVKKQKPGEVNFWKFNDLNSLILTIGEPLMRIGLPASLNTPEMRADFRNILSKMWKRELDSDLNDRILKYKNLVKETAKASNCSDAPAMTSTLNALADELRTIRSNIENLETAGRKQAAREAEAVRTTGRSRPQLPYPSLTDREREWVTTWVGGLYWRARGGGILEEPQGTQATRIYFTMMTMRVLGQLNGGEAGARAGESLYWDLFAPWGREMDMGRANGDRHTDAVNMSVRGLDQVSTAKKMLLNAGYDASDLVLGGLQMGPCYYYSWDRLAEVKVGLELGKPLYSPLMTEPTEWGEVCTGAVISLGLSRSLLKGTSSGSTWSATSGAADHTR